MVETSTAEEPPQDQPEAQVVPERRRFLERLSGWMMFIGLASGYGAFAAAAGRFLMPASSVRKEWVFVSRIDDIASGDSIPYKLPNGAQVAIARLGESDEIKNFLALSSICPHLGCQVHWEGKNQRFFCPCHNGAFDAQGNPTEGPPKEGGQSLASYPLRIERRLLYIEVSLDGKLGERAKLEKVVCTQRCSQLDNPTQGAI